MRPFVRALLTCSAVVLFAATALAQGSSPWVAPPLSKIPKQPTETASTAVTAPSAGQVTPMPIKFVTPSRGATTRGVVDVKVVGVRAGGYVIFRIDGQFAYAVGSPYKMRWDTEGAEDGEHTISATAYDSQRRPAGSASISITVKNRIDNAVPAGGLPLRLSLRRDQTIVRNVEGVAEVSGLDVRESLPQGITGVDGRLFARFSQSVMDANPATRSADVRTSVRFGTLSSGDKEIDIQETGRYGVISLLSTGIGVPPAATSKRPRVGLGEISLTLPTGRVIEGDTWQSPMWVVPELVRRNAVNVVGKHTFEGVWWLKGRKCARIYSTYDVGDIALVGTIAGLTTVSAPAAAEYRLELTQGAPMMQGQGMPPGMGMGMGMMANPAMRGQIPGAAVTPGARALTPQAQAAPKVTARLSGLSGMRLTWIDIERGVVVRTEDRVTGTLVLTGLGDDNVSPLTPPATTARPAAAATPARPAATATPMRPAMTPGFPTSAVPAQEVAYTLVLTQGGPGGGVPGGGGSGGGSTITPGTGTTTGVTTGTTTRTATTRTTTTRRTSSTSGRRTSGFGGGSRSRAGIGGRNTGNRGGNYRNTQNRVRRVLRDLPEREEALPTAERLPYSMTLVIELAD